MAIKQLLSLSLILLIVACKQPIDPDNIYNYRAYVSHTTSGQISRTAPINIHLSRHTTTFTPGDILNAELIKTTPHVQGQLQLINSNTLVFVPDEALDSGVEYSVTLDLSGFFPTISKDLSSYTFGFKTIEAGFTVNTKSLQSYNKEWQYLSGQLQSADVISLQHAQQLISASQDDKKLNISWNELIDNSKYFEFKIDSIERHIEDSKVSIAWDGTAIKAPEIKGENSVIIPGRNNFNVVQVEVIQSPEQYLSLNFSDPIKKQQNFTGLVSLQNESDLDFVVDGNILKVYPKSRVSGALQLDIFTGIKNTDGYSLKSNYSDNITFEALKPQVRLLSNGVILPNSKDLKLNFEAVNLSAVDVRIIKIYNDNVLQFLQDANLNSTEAYGVRAVGRRIAKKTISLINSKEQNTGKWKAYSIDLAKLMIADPGAIYRVELSFTRQYALYTCDNAESYSNYEDDYSYYEDDFNTYSDPLSAEEQDLREEQYWNNESYSYKNENYRWRDKNNPCTDSYYNYPNRTVAQHLLASNLGVIAKQDQARYIFAVTNLLNTQPEPNAEVTLYNFQQQELQSAKTNSEGIAELDYKHSAAFAVVRKNNNTAYLKLNDGNALSLSKFDVSGQRLKRGLKGYLYGERGVWRPGDSLHLTFVLNDKNNPLPAHHPVKLELTDPVGKLVYKSVSTTHLNHFYSFKVPTATSYTTGTYTAVVSVGGAKFNKSLKIENVKPNRLKINMDLGDGILQHQKPLAGTLKVAWLHGAPAKNIKAEVKAKFTAASTKFKNYPNYVFDDPSKNFNTEEVVVFDAKLNASGEAKLQSKIAIGQTAPGMVNAQFLVRAFETGGDFSMDAFVKPYAPYDHFIGLKSPKGNDYGSYYTDENHSFEVVSVNQNGQGVKKEGLQVKVYKIEWRWWWNSSYDDLSSYVSSSYHRPIQEFELDTDSTGKGQFTLTIAEEQRGRFLIRVLDPDGGHSTGRTAYFYKDWWGNSTDQNKEAAQMLVFSADKSTYHVGDTAKFKFPSSENGRALISIENGTDVLDYQWVATQKDETTVELPITAEMAPNVFINISLLQEHQVSSNDLPIRLYGVIPLMVENPQTRLSPKLKINESLRPKSKYQVNISEDKGKPMTYTIAIVEEGLLDLTRFKTPNIWNSFYAREALGVKTWDIYNDVIGAYSGSIDQVFAIGGDGSLAAGKNKKANRFKPVVSVLGPFELKANETKTHHLSMPNYVGSVRAMLIAGDTDKEAYGSTEVSVKVKQPLMTLATLPRKLSPGETVTLPVTVFAMDKTIKNVQVSIKTSGAIKPIGKTSQDLKFSTTGEQMLYFELDVLKAGRAETIEVIATGHGESSSYKVELDVINPNPISTELISEQIEANSQKTIAFSSFGISGSNSAMVEFSTLPPINLNKRIGYLIQYPHGCVEQTTSSVFPQLFLGDILDITGVKKAEIQNNIKQGIDRLAQFQQPNGGLSYWMGEQDTNDWGSSYAGHFMLEAEQKGFVLPLSFKANWIRYQKRVAREWRPSFRNTTNDLTQAYRLYTLALAGTPDLASMNRLREYTDLSYSAKWRLAAAYALAGQEEAASSLITPLGLEFSDEDSNQFSYGSTVRNEAMALETMVITNDSRKADLARSLAKSLSSDIWMSTQTTAFGLLAMSKFIIENGGKTLDLNYTFNGSSFAITSTKGIAQQELKLKDGPNRLTINNQQNNLVYIRLLNSGKLPLGQEKRIQRGLSINTTYKNTQGQNLDISELRQGEDVVVTIKVDNLTNKAVKDIALTQIVPSGWEIVNTRFTDFGDSTSNTARYMDIKDDRIHFYFDLGRSGNRGSKTFSFLINAAYLGKYYLPGTQAEAMYDDDYMVRHKGQWIHVKQ